MNGKRGTVRIQTALTDRDAPPLQSFKGEGLEHAPSVFVGVSHAVANVSDGHELDCIMYHAHMCDDCVPPPHHCCADTVWSSSHAGVAEALQQDEEATLASEQCRRR